MLAHAYGIGFWEILVVLAVAIIVLGPEKCIGAAKKAGRLWGRAHNNLDDVRRNIEDMQGSPKDEAQEEAER